MKEQFVAKRIVNIGLIFLVAIGFSVIAGRMSGMYLDQLLGNWSIDGSVYGFVCVSFDL